MIQWFSQNWGTVAVVAVLAAVLVAIVVCRVRARRAGKGGCGCGCAQCALRESCHTVPDPKQK